ncbi:acyltransferase family protein [Segatella bryantii]|uniref:acyltransferase family protein n=1 Tax=Segatella bryantii TaxID=77095 RepID=UPI0028530DBF|nr:acyltransferase [Segatella bryantii]MDR4931519.1 acyltransferase [Segatella bryantii]
MKYNNEIDFFRTILIGLVILVHIVNFGNIYPSIKEAILAFIMPTFLVITGYLVNINKSVKDYVLYILKIWLPYMILVTGFAVLSLFLPVRDGIKVLNTYTILHVLFIKSIGPYWFLHAMIVCGIIYYFAFHFTHKINITAKYSIFATLLIAISLLTPFLNIKIAIYYFIGVGIRQYSKDFSQIYKRSLWPIIPFGLIITNTIFYDWGTISVLICVICFLSFTSYFFSFIKGRAELTVEYIGRNTFPIYLFHPIFTMLSKYLLPAFRFDSTGVLHAVFTILISIIGSIYIAKILDWSHLSILLGRKKVLR